MIYALVGGRPWAILKGRVHLYEGRGSGDVTAGVRLLHALGCGTVILTNAAGTLNAAHPPGTWMALSDHLNLTGTTPLLGGPNFVDMSEVYDANLRASFVELATQAGMPLHQGVYAGLLGPQYETPAEIRMLRAIGADAVGMSTVLEAIQARALGMRVAGFSCLTNWAAGMSSGGLSHGEVLETGREAASALCALLEMWAQV
jgi:purine-nucleoside phosphorylase